MKDEIKTKEQLIAELVEMRPRVAELEAAETERKRAEEGIQRKMEDLTLINSLNNAVNRGDSLHEIIQLLSSETTQIASGGGATAYLVSEDKEYLVMQNLVLPPAMVNRIEQLIGIKIPTIKLPLKAGSLYMETLQTGKPLLINDPATIQRLMAQFTETVRLSGKPLRKTLQKLIPQIHKVLGIQSVIIVPLVSEGEAIGLLDISNKEPFTESDLHRLDAISGQLTAIIKHKQTEEALKEYSKRLEEMVDERTAELQAQYAWLDAILRSTTDGIVVTNEEGSIAQANPVAQAWLTQTLSPEEADRLREAIRSVVTRVEEQPVELLELTGLDLELSAALIVEEGAEKPTAAVVDIHDVSHLKALDRMKTRFITNISHELRTPISTIKLYAYLMRQHPEKWKQHLDTLAQEADHQARLVEDILEISRLDAGRIEMKPCPTSLNELVETTVVRRQVLAQERGLTLEHHLAKPGLVTPVDPERMMQVLDNLVGNAIRHTPEGGKVVVSTGTEEAEGRTWATVTVADTGMGIPEDEWPHLFDRFFRGEKPRSMQISGTGLGLAIVKEIVELHGGRVTVQSQVDVGSTFTVWLPLDD